jgi:hypothetical protein
MFVDDLMLFVSSLDSTMLNISNIVLEDKKQHVSET